MDNVRRIGLKPVPDDVDIARFLEKMINEYTEKLSVIEKELAETLQETSEMGEPTAFAFGRLVNYLASLGKPELIELLAISMWKNAAT